MTWPYAYRVWGAPAIPRPGIGRRHFPEYAPISMYFSGPGGTPVRNLGPRKRGPRNIIHVPAGGRRPHGIGRLWKGIWAGVSRLSLRLFRPRHRRFRWLLLRFFAYGRFGVGCVVSRLRRTCLALRLVLGLVAVVFEFGDGSSFVRWFRVCV